MVQDNIDTPKIDTWDSFKERVYQDLRSDEVALTPHSQRHDDMGVHGPVGERLATTENRLRTIADVTVEDYRREYPNRGVEFVAEQYGRDNEYRSKGEEIDEGYSIGMGR